MLGLKGYTPAPGEVLSGWAAAARCMSAAPLLAHRPRWVGVQSLAVLHKRVGPGQRVLWQGVWGSRESQRAPFFAAGYESKEAGS